jgi:hypothetical protein
MTKYRMNYMLTVTDHIIIEAESKDEAITKFQKIDMHDFENCSDTARIYNMELLFIQ